ncbi:hypothetical protein HAX54_041411 [Datura stramonium]|uniref:Uncharacterized protein n=1 Tax=Datura stramonium TaxID=4076 RepID=A0ABS8VRB0_DATST|nr:hypothetical protein [Datura stramonium]
MVLWLLTDVAMTYIPLLFTAILPNIFMIDTILIGDEVGTTTIGYSLIESGKIPMERQFRLILASGHCLDPALHQRFADRDRRFSDLSSIEYLLPSFLFLTTVQRRSTDTLLQFAGVSSMLPVL